MRLGIVLTAHCNATCAHCSKSYGPRRTEHLDKPAIIRLMNEAAQIEDGLPLAFDLTGGEPFLDFELLLEVVSHGSRLGAQVSCVTNAFWARNEVVTRTKLIGLRASGLTLLSVSVSRFHQRYVAIDRVRQALGIASELGIETELKGAVTSSDLKPGGLRDTWKKELDADWVSIFPVLPRLRDGESLPEEEYYREPGLPQQRCPGDMVCVDFDGLARSCCTLGHGDAFLVVGNVHSMPLQQIHEKFRHAGKQRILREIGPVEFARGAVAAGLEHRLRAAYAGPCDLCLHVQSDPQLRDVAEAMANAADHDTGIINSDSNNKEGQLWRA
jgi:MoaA/NifB/PqqE/SkfB family radical SAM enzyme